MKNLLRFIAFVLMVGNASAQSKLPACQGSDAARWSNCFGEITKDGQYSYSGDFLNGRLQGFGTMIGLAPNFKGDKLVGEFKDGKLDGQGTYTHANGAKYVGEFKDGKRHGQGTLTSTNGNKYVGEFKDGLANGKGTNTVANGDKLVGEFKDGKLDGQGTYTHANGAKYVGAFKDGKRHGQGTFTFDSGDKYVGEWKDSRYNGQGTFFFLANNQFKGNKYVGEYKDGKRNGQGTYTFANGNKYVGEYKEDRYNGQGTFTFPDGTKYVGEFKDGKANGQGITTSANGSKHVGEYKDDSYNGQGTFTFANGSKYVGEFKDDKRTGQGTLFASNGSVIDQGIWADEKLVRSVPVQQAGGANQTFPIVAAQSNTLLNSPPACQGSDQKKWHFCTGAEDYDFPVLRKFVGIYLNGERNGVGIEYAKDGSVIRSGTWKGFYRLVTSHAVDIQKFPFNTSTLAAVTSTSTPDSSNTERDRFTAEAESKKRQELEQQLSAAKERERITAELDLERKKRQEVEQALALNKEQERLTYEARIKEQQRLALEASEISRLRAESQESKRKQVELEEQLRLAKLQNQVNPPAAITTLANRKALVIGNDTYKSVTKLLNAREDAKAIASNLTAVGYKVTLQLDLNEKEMKAALRTFSSQVQGGDEVMFFFAGHGVQLGATNYLLPTDIAGESEAQVKDEAIQLQRVLDDMTEKKAKFTLAMIDACRDNPFKTAGRAIGGRGMAPTTAATGQMVVFSAGTGQQALDRLGNNDKNKNGVFTRTFLKEMQKPGVSIDRIVKNVRNEVAELAKTVGHEQVPAIYDQVLGDFYFKK